MNAILTARLGFTYFGDDGVDQYPLVHPETGAVRSPGEDGITGSAPPACPEPPRN
jgi:hypothetical protein